MLRGGGVFTVNSACRKRSLGYNAWCYLWTVLGHNQCCEILYNELKTGFLCWRCVILDFLQNLWWVGCSEHCVNLNAGPQLAQGDMQDDLFRLDQAMETCTARLHFVFKSQQHDAMANERWNSWTAIWVACSYLDCHRRGYSNENMLIPELVTVWLVEVQKLLFIWWIYF